MSSLDWAGTRRYRCDHANASLAGRRTYCPAVHQTNEVYGGHGVGCCVCGSIEVRTDKLNKSAPLINRRLRVWMTGKELLEMEGDLS